jgi:hypothetical protein
MARFGYPHQQTSPTSFHNCNTVAWECSGEQAMTCGELIAAKAEKG